MSLSPSAPLSYRCPSTGKRLLRVAPDRMSAEDGSISYPILDGIPVLIPRESVFFDEDHLLSTSRPQQDQSSRALTIGRTLAGALPTFSRVGPSRENYLQMLELLQERARASGRKQRLLVVGGATLGSGSDILLESPLISVTEVDVARGPRTAVVCDAHHLPFFSGSFDAVACQAVLEHVLDPPAVVAEIHRVLTADGLVYSEIPFMQQVHEGAYDFTRYTLLGHRRLFRFFDEISSGAQGGPGMALGWSIKYFCTSFFSSRAVRAVIGRSVLALLFWLKYCDAYLSTQPGGVDAASGTYFFGQRRDTPVSDIQVLDSYQGAGPRAAMRIRN